MSSKSRTGERLYTVGFMLAITAVFISAVSALHLATATVVGRNANLYLQRAVLEAAGLDPAGEPAEVIDRYAENIRPLEAGLGPNKPGFRVVDPGSGETRGYAFVQTGAGLWGTIRGVVGLNRERDALTGVTFLEHNETPGLGARIAEEWFKSQFKGKTGPFRRVPEGTRSDLPTEFDAITGATVTSKAVETMLNKTLAEAPKALEREDNG